MAHEAAGEPIEPGECLFTDALEAVRLAAANPPVSPQESNSGLPDRDRRGMLVADATNNIAFTGDLEQYSFYALQVLQDWSLGKIGKAWGVSAEDINLIKLRFWRNVRQQYRRLRAMG